MMAQQSLNKLGNQMENKERVWKGQLEAMERQSKLLKLQLSKKEQVQSLKQASGNSTTMIDSKCNRLIVDLCRNLFSINSDANQQDERVEELGSERDTAAYSSCFA